VLGPAFLEIRLPHYDFQKDLYLQLLPPLKIHGDATLACHLHKALRYKLSLRDLPEMFQERGFEFSHESVRSWILRFTPLLVAELRKKRSGKTGISWYVEPAREREGEWAYLYRAIDRDGGLVDTMLSKTRNMSTVKRFFASAIKATGSKPKRVTTDKHPPYL